jgi:hypothetical protein
LEVEKERSWEEALAVGVGVYFRKGRLVLEKHTMRLLPRDFASSQSAEVGVVFVAAAAGEGTGYKSHFAVLQQATLGWLPNTSYHNACALVEWFHR